MALKRKISKTKFDKLPADIKAEYQEKDGEYILDIDGDEDIGAMSRAKIRETEKRRTAEDKLKVAEKDLAKLKKIETDNDEITARKKGDIITLEKSWSKKHNDAVALSDAKIAKQEVFIKKSLLNDKAMAIASKISLSPKLILPHIISRLSVDLEGDEPQTKVLDASGKISAMTIDELSEEFIANKDYSAIIIGSRASGSSATNGTKNTSNRGSAMTADEKPTMLSNQSPIDLAAHIKTVKERQE